MMSDAVDFRQRALDLLSRAAAAGNHRERSELICAAASWHMLANLDEDRLCMSSLAWRSDRDRRQPA